VRTCIEELKRFNLVAEDSKRGVMWVLNEDPGFWREKGFLRLR